MSRREFYGSFDHWLATSGNPLEDQHPECPDCGAWVIDGDCEGCDYTAPEPDWEQIARDQEDARHGW